MPNDHGGSMESKDNRALIAYQNKQAKSYLGVEINVFEFRDDEI